MANNDKLLLDLLDAASGKDPLKKRMLSTAFPNQTGQMMRSVGELGINSKISNPGMEPVAYSPFSSQTAEPLIAKSIDFSKPLPAISFPKSDDNKPKEAVKSADSNKVPSPTENSTGKQMPITEEHTGKFPWQVFSWMGDQVAGRKVGSSDAYWSEQESREDKKAKEQEEREKQAILDDANSGISQSTQKLAENLIGSPGMFKGRSHSDIVRMLPFMKEQLDKWADDEANRIRSMQKDSRGGQGNQEIETLGGLGSALDNSESILEKVKTTNTGIFPSLSQKADTLAAGLGIKKPSQSTLDVQDVEQKIGYLLADYQRAVSGLAVTEQESKRLSALIGGIRNDPTTIKNSLKNFNDEMFTSAFNRIELSRLKGEAKQYYIENLKKKLEKAHQLGIVGEDKYKKYINQGDIPESSSISPQGGSTEKRVVDTQRNKAFPGKVKYIYSDGTEEIRDEKK